MSVPGIDRLRQLERNFRERWQNPTVPPACAPTRRCISMSMRPPARPCCRLIATMWLKAGPIINLDLGDASRRSRSAASVSNHAELVAAIAARDPAIPARLRATSVHRRFHPVARRVARLSIFKNGETMDLNLRNHRVGERRRRRHRPRHRRGLSGRGRARRHLRYRRCGLPCPRASFAAGRCRRRRVRKFVHAIRQPNSGLDMSGEQCRASPARPRGSGYRPGRRDQCPICLTSQFVTCGGPSASAKAATRRSSTCPRSAGRFGFGCAPLCGGEMGVIG